MQMMSTNFLPNPDDMSSNNQKKLPNPANFKIVKCKNFEREGHCKYGNTCTFAHGETELRTKTENSIPGGFNNTNNMPYPPYMMDPNLFFLMQNQMNMSGYPGNMGKSYIIFSRSKSVRS